MSNRAWKHDELTYLLSLIRERGDGLVGRQPKTIACYLRLQAADAFRAGHINIAASLGDAATAINESADNIHAPDWARAEMVILALLA